MINHRKEKPFTITYRVAAEIKRAVVYAADLATAVGKAASYAPAHDLVSVAVYGA